MVVLYQSFHKALYFQLILFCAFLLHPEDDSVLCLKSYHEAPKESHNTSTTYLYSKHGRDNVESTGKQSGTAHKHHTLSVWIARYEWIFWFTSHIRILCKISFPTKILELKRTSFDSVAEIAFVHCNLVQIKILYHCRESEKVSFWLSHIFRKL